LKRPPALTGRSSSKERTKRLNFFSPKYPGVKNVRKQRRFVVREEKEEEEEE